MIPPRTRSSEMLVATLSGRVEAFEASLDRVTRQMRSASHHGAPTRASNGVKLVGNGPGVSVGRLGHTVQFDSISPGVASVVGDAWMPSGRHARVWSATLLVGSLEADTCIGIVGRNFWHPSNWATPLDESKHAVAVRVGDGSVTRKGVRMPLALRPLLRSSAMRLP